MLVIMCGLPASGKSQFVNAMAADFHASVIRPGDDIETWSECVNRVANKLYHNDGNVIFDTCAASPNALKQIFTMASIKSREIVVIWVNADKTLCKERFRGEKEIVESYVPKIKNALMEYQSRYKLIVVQNDGSLDDLHRKAKAIVKKLCLINGLRK